MNFPIGKEKKRVVDIFLENLLCFITTMPSKKVVFIEMARFRTPTLEHQKRMLNRLHQALTWRRKLISNVTTLMLYSTVGMGEMLSLEKQINFNIQWSMTLTDMKLTEFMRLTEQSATTELYFVNKLHDFTGIYYLSGNFYYNDFFRKTHARLYTYLKSHNMTNNC